ncbi:NAD(P)/FAD-dependent oxidoreductase [Streptomyces sp. SP17KL33]|uniref:NAD(P)/FAD-dependent oxidoreductase n=1 Tax=Streptomyces sp. SP17KL33 TaxID=3002534 RepID=UPI002E763C87|nr:FAD-dependent monooxygenase [Streptomyces sp. SP17KL33]MEE1835797.1 FAD-dependent monooxygenase [Streptomyces sp. SP17KL33]
MGSDEQVVVIGAGMAGLLSAAVIATTGRCVTLLEQDPVSAWATPEPRGGVPQGRQPHVLLYSGLHAIEGLLPGLRAELIAAGGVPLDTGDLAWLGERGWAPFGTPAFELVSATRPLVEHTVRRRVVELPGVEVRGGVRVRGLSRTGTAATATAADADADADADGGWLVECFDGPSLRAGLVVDASGRSSRLPEWLGRLGIERAETSVVDAGFGYAGRVYAAPPDRLGRVAGIVMLPVPGAPAGGVALPVEEGRWMVAAVGAGESRPPRDPAGFDAFLGRLRDPALADFTRAARPVGDITVHRRTHNVRRRYDRLPHWPDGLLVLGDALCAFNPVYGQGITVAATQALLLREALATRPRPGWERRLMRRLHRAADLPWAIATGEDRRHLGKASQAAPDTAGAPKTPGIPRPLDALDALFGRWSGEVDRLAVHGDLRAQRALDRVYHLVGSPAGLLHPALLTAAARARLLGLPPASPRPPIGAEAARPRLP